MVAFLILKVYRSNKYNKMMRKTLPDKKIFYTSNYQEDYKFSSICTALQIHRDHPANEDILIFLTGQEEIEDAAKLLRSIIPALDNGLSQLMVLPLYSSLPHHQQMRVFKPTPKGSRKVILSTNIAETSVTIQGIKHVIDSGMVKQKTYINGLDKLTVCRVSQAQAWQRSGRAGRHQPGCCYRLYTEEAFSNLKFYPANTVPEILRCPINPRCNLVGALLQIISLGIRDIRKFDFVEKPSEDNIERSLDQLRCLGALLEHEEEGEIILSKVGKQLSQFPLDPKFSKVILVASESNCLEDVLAIVSLLSTESIVNTPSDEKRRSEAISIRKKFQSSIGDHFTKLNIYKKFRTVQDVKWCHENYLNRRNLLHATKIHKQLKEICTRMNLSFDSCSNSIECIQRSFISGFFSNTVELGQEGKYKTIDTGDIVYIHPSSSSFGKKPPYLIYNELIQTSKKYMRDVMVVESDWIQEYIPKLVKEY